MTLRLHFHERKKVYVIILTRSQALLLHVNLCFTKPSYCIEAVPFGSVFQHQIRMIQESKKYFQRKWGRRGRDHIIVGFITTYAISAYHGVVSLNTAPGTPVSSTIKSDRLNVTKNCCKWH